ncbi:MAG: hypothetical protein LLG40_14880 [Deltaproteobacteria bacterium]|nr:hypothetical protein [Deltaproteobacteria bacterium]
MKHSIIKSFLLSIITVIVTGGISLVFFSIGGRHIEEGINLIGAIFMMPGSLIGYLLAGLLPNEIGGMILYSTILLVQIIFWTVIWFRFLGRDRRTFAERFKAGKSGTLGKK